MSKRNRNNKRQKRRSLLQELKRERKSDLYKNIIQIVKACGAYDAFKKLSDNDLIDLSLVQIREVKVKPQIGYQIKNSIISNINKKIQSVLRSKKIKLKGVDHEFTLHEIATAGETLWMSSLKREEHNIWEELYQKLEPLWEYFCKNEENLIINIIANLLQDITERYSHIDGCFYWITWKFEYKRLNSSSVYLLHKEKCTSKPIIINNKKRLIYRVGYSVQHEGMRWATVKGCELEKLNSWINIKREYPIYIQYHALKRLKERLFPIPIYERLLYVALIEPEISKGPDGKIFIALKHAGCKLGYLLGVFTGKELVIVSFLFITNSGTIEGTQLNKSLHVEAYSKSYFKLDLLKTYIITDICIDPYFSSLLKKCGCADLIKYKQYFRDESDANCHFSEELKKELAIDKLAG